MRKGLSLILAITIIISCFQLNNMEAHASTNIIYDWNLETDYGTNPLVKTYVTFPNNCILDMVRVYHKNPSGNINLTLKNSKNTYTISNIPNTESFGGSKEYKIMRIENPNIYVEAGTYEVISSEPSTWIYNSGTGGRGFLVINASTIYITDVTDIEGIISITPEDPVIVEPEVPVITIPEPIVEPEPPVITTPEVDDSAIVFLKIGNPLMYINQVEQEIDPGRNTVPIIKDGRTLLPIKALIEGLGGTVQWYGDERKVSIKLNNNHIETWIGSKSYKINGVSKTMDVAPVIINSRTMVPLRFVAENLNATVHWEGTQKVVMVSYFGSTATVKAINEANNSYYISDTSKGYVINYEDKVNVYIPKNTLSKPDRITITPISLSGVDPSVAQVLYAYDISIGDQHTFNNNITIRFPYDKSKMDKNYSDELQLFAATYNEATGKLENIPFSVVSSTGLFFIETNHLSAKTVFKMDTNGQYFVSTVQTNNLQKTSTPSSNSGYFQSILTALNNKVITPISNVASDIKETVGGYIDDIKDAVDSVVSATAGWTTAIKLGFNMQDYILYKGGRFGIVYNDNTTFTKIEDAFSYLKTNYPNYRSDFGSIINSPSYEQVLYFKKDGKVNPVPSTSISKVVPDGVKDLMYGLNEYEKRLKAVGIEIKVDKAGFIPIYVLPISRQYYDEVTNAVYSGMSIKESAYSVTDTIIQNATHELFHYIQYNNYYAPHNSASALTSMATNDWINEATAEYASVVYGLNRGLMKNPDSVVMKDNFYSEAISEDSDPHYYQSAYFIEYLVNEEGLKLHDFLTYYAAASHTDQYLYPETIIEGYFKDKLKRSEKVTDLYAKFLGYMLLKDEGPNKNRNVNTTPINKSTESTFNTNTNKWEQSLGSTAYTPKILSVELPKGGPYTSTYQVSMPCTRDQVIYVYGLDDNKKVSNPTPITVLKGEGEKVFSIQVDAGKAKTLYFISMSSTVVSENNKIVMMEADNITTVKQVLHVERDTVTDPETNETYEVVVNCEGYVELELEGFEDVLNVRYVWDMGEGDGKEYATNTNTFNYTYKNLTEAYNKSMSNPFLEVANYDISVTVYRVIEGESQYWFSAQGYVNFSGFSIE